MDSMLNDEDMKRVREATGLGLREARERIRLLVADGYPPESAAEALIAAGPNGQHIDWT